MPKSEIAKQNMRNNATHHGGKEVAMFDKDNNLIRIFKTCGLASKETGIKAVQEVLDQVQVVIFGDINSKRL